MVNQPAGVNTDLLRELAYEREVVSTDLTEEKLIQKTVHLYPRLRYIASARETTTYEQVSEGFKISSYARIGRVLGLISAMEHERGRPLISAVVTSASNEFASDGFFVLVENLGVDEVPEEEYAREALWQKHLDEVYDYWATRGRLGST